MPVWPVAYSSAYWIQISGASGLAASELADTSFIPGSASSAVFDDLAGIGDIRDLVRAHKTSRVVDNYVLDVAQGPSSATVKTALVWPPIIYGPGEGPGNQRSYQVPALARVALERGRPVKVGEGANRWGNIHIRDLGRLIGSLVDAAVKDDQRSEVWGQNGIYLTGTGELVRTVYHITTLFTLIPLYCSLFLNITRPIISLHLYHGLLTSPFTIGCQCLPCCCANAFYMQSILTSS